MHFYKFFNKIDLFFCKAKQIVYRPIIFNIFYWRTRNIFYVLLTHLHSTIIKDCNVFKIVISCKRRV